MQECWYCPRSAVVMPGALGFFENGLHIRFEGVAFGQGIDHFAHVVKPFRAVKAFIPPFHFPNRLPGFRIKQDCFVYHHPDGRGPAECDASELIFEMALVKANDAKLLDVGAPIACERFFNELLDGGHAYFPSLWGWDAGIADSCTCGQRIMCGRLADGGRHSTGVQPSLSVRES